MLTPTRIDGWGIIQHQRSAAIKQWSRDVSRRWLIPALIAGVVAAVFTSIAAVERRAAVANLSVALESERALSAELARSYSRYMTRPLDNGWRLSIDAPTRAGMLTELDRVRPALARDLASDQPQRGSQ